MEWDKDDSSAGSVTTWGWQGGTAYDHLAFCDRCGGDEAGICHHVFHPR